MILWQNHHNRAMKYNLPIVTYAAVVVAQLSLAAEPNRSETTQTPAARQLVSDAAARLAEWPALRAKIRQQASLFGQTVVGSGTYQQKLVDGTLRIRLELRLQVAGQLTSLQQISDGVTLWTRRDEGDTKSVAYVNLRRIREAFREPQSPPQTPQLPLLQAPSQAAAGVGLHRMLQALVDGFDFDSARPANFGSVPVWVVRGRWKTDPPTRPLAPPRETDAALSSATKQPLFDHVPDVVTVYLGRDDFIPLFPYCIEYGRAAGRDDRRSPRSAASDNRLPRLPLATIELYEVHRNPELDPQSFVYKLDEQETLDQTDQYLRRLGLQPADEN